MTQLYGISTSVFMRRGDEVLLLKRALGEAVGSWYIPGGGLEPGETLEAGARRELVEETGLVIDGDFHLVAVTPMHAYGNDIFTIAYACEYEAGEVKLSDEHSGSRWVDVLAYRDKYFSEAAMAIVEGRSAGAAKLARSVQAELDAYISWRSH
jgi:8-oxo-dGTP diphosphatase